MKNCDALSVFCNLARTQTRALLAHFQARARVHQDPDAEDAIALLSGMPIGLEAAALIADTCIDTLPPDLLSWCEPHAGHPRECELLERHGAVVHVPPASHKGVPCPTSCLATHRLTSGVVIHGPWAAHATVH